jgi:hypothetical protein
MPTSIFLGGNAGRDREENAIMMTDFALEAQRIRRKSPAEATYEACLARFRPSMMTTMAALMGTPPMAVEGGPGVSQLPTLYITPVVYIYRESLRGLGSRPRRGPKARKEAVEVAPSLREWRR